MNTPHRRHAGGQVDRLLGEIHHTRARPQTPQASAAPIDPALRHRQGRR
ncbi:hypothetical protein ACQP1S_11905 [Micromonospora matsumotoense]